MKKRILSLMLSVVMACGLVTTAHAETIDWDTMSDKEIVENRNQNILDGSDGISYYLGMGQIYTDEMAEVAAKVVGDETDPYKKARMLHEWTNKNIKYDYTFSSTHDPLEAFENRIGVCDDIATIFVSLCQSQGIPAFSVPGTAIGKNSKNWYYDAVHLSVEGRKYGYVGYHEWAAFYANGEWHWADPTWGSKYFDQDNIEFSKSHYSDDPNDNSRASEWAAFTVLDAYTSGIFSPELAQKWSRWKKFDKATISINHANCTRADFCDLAVSLVEKALGKSIDQILADRGLTPGSFSDTTDENVLNVAALGIVGGVGGGRFDPDAELTREQAAVILMRTAKAIGKDMSTDGTTPFTDVDGNAWSTDGIVWCYANGVMGGTSNTTFAPKSPYTREQAVVTFYRLFQTID